MPFEWFVAIRYLRDSRAQTVLILAAVSIGVSVIVFLSALIGGLQASLLKRTLDTQPHVTLAPEELVARPLLRENVRAAVTIERSPQRLQSIHRWRTLLDQVERVRGVVAASPTVTGAAFASRGVAQRPVVVRAIDPERFVAVVDVRSRVTRGRYRLTGNDVLIGKGLAELLGSQVGDKVRVSTGDGREALVIVRGVFDLGNESIDERWIFVPLRIGQTLFDMPGGASTIELRVGEVFEAERIGVELADLTGLEADSWMKINEQLLVGLRSQESSKLMIQVFVVIAVALGIASVLIVSVVQKSREIGILRAVGSSSGRVLRIFLIQGGVLGLLGSIVGSALGAAFSLFFERLATGPDGSPTFPVDLSPELFVGASALAIGIGLVSALLPARRASRLDPATAIRNG
ncbi:MAG: ABC transporter permease [Deltaproteobacteria bacterium]|nr:ABC transporter permease [Deltaproteobacteria bacterium]